MLSMLPFEKGLRKGDFMFGKKKKQKKTFDREQEKPVIHASICNGEQVAGFKNISTGKFSEVMLIRGRNDLNEFMEMYGIVESEITKEY